MIEVLGLSKTFARHRKRKERLPSADPREDGRSFHALSDIEFIAPKGKITGLLGSNGAGKTTLLRILATSLKPGGGTARVDGEDIIERTLQVRRKVGFLSGNTGLYGRLTPYETLTFFGQMYGLRGRNLEQRIRQLVDELSIASFADQRCDSLSTGMKQKVSIARSLIHEPEVIIFDEPTTGLDVAAAKGILSFIERCRRGKKSVIFSTHHMHEVDKLCDSVVIIHQGKKCFEGSVQKMREASGQVDLDDAYLALIENASQMRGGANRAQ